MTVAFKGAPIDPHQPDGPQTEVMHSAKGRDLASLGRFPAREACRPRAPLSNGRYPDIIRLSPRPPSRAMIPGRRSSLRQRELKIKDSRL